jgi:glycosyltransferase involved in cell wall biosynthesis
MSTLPYPKISVVTPCFNSKHTVRETIESVRRQDYPNVEHVVFDGGSTDGTLEILREYPHLVLTSEKDEGHYHAMDKGIRKATGDVFAVLNADDCYRPGVLARVAEGFAKHPKWDALAGDMVFVDGNGNEIFRREEAFVDKQIIWYGFHNVANHQAMFLKRDFYLKLGPYRYKEFKNCCDSEYLMRLVKAGCNFGHINTLIVNYRYHEHGQSADLRVRANMAKEFASILKEYGVPGGFAGKCLLTYARIKRQVEKLIFRGKCDLIPGQWLLKKHLVKEAKFSSNIGVDKLGKP